MGLSFYQRLSLSRILQGWFIRWFYIVIWYYKSLKQNVSLCKSPTKTVDSQANNFFAALWGYVKLEVLKLTSKLNHFALKFKLYIKALQQAFLEWQSLKPF